MTEISVTNGKLHLLLKKELKVKNFIGVFPADMWPKRMSDGQSFISNTDPSHLPGKHYVTIFKNRGVYFYFDPLAMPMSFYPAIWKNKVKKRWHTYVRVLRSPIQDPTSRFCGYFCCNYVLSHSLHYGKLVQLGSLFLEENELIKNDKIAVKNVIRCIKQRRK